MNALLLEKIGKPVVIWGIHWDGAGLAGSSILRGGGEMRKNIWAHCKVSILYNQVSRFRLGRKLRFPRMGMGESPGDYK